MKAEIDRDFYCSTAGMVDCPDRGDCMTCLDCPDRHRKHPTPEQYKEEYGEEPPDNMAVYVDVDLFIKGDDGQPVRTYMLHTYRIYKQIITKTAEDPLVYNQYFNVYGAICACTPFGKPDRDWRP